MGKAEVEAEEHRLAVLRRYAIVDTPPSDVFDEAVRLAADVCEAPIALISFVDELRQWFKAVIGLPLRETPRAAAICASAMYSNDVFVVPDLSADRRFASNPLVRCDPHLRFYAGAALATSEGVPLGTVSVLDTCRRARGLSSEQATALKGLAALVMRELELRREAIRRTEELCRLQKPFDHAPIALAIVSPEEQRFEYANDLFEHLLATPGLMGRRLAELMRPDASEPFLDALSNSCREKQPSEGKHVPVRLHHRTPVFVNYSNKPALDEAGNAFAVVVVAIDVSEELHARSELKRIELQLDHARQLSTVGVVGAMIAHELNQPLGAALNYASAARMISASGTPDIALIESTLTKSMEQIQRASALLRRVRDLSKGQRPAAQATSLAECIGHVEQLLREAGAHVSISIDIGYDVVIADRIQIEQVFMNLFRNSHDVALLHHQTPIIIVRTRLITPDLVEIEVRDSGPGFRPAQLAEVFNPFHESSTDGMGLGLSIIHSVIEAHGGSICASNADGAVITFTLPAGSMERQARQ